MFGYVPPGFEIRHRLFASWGNSRDRAAYSALLEIPKTGADLGAQHGSKECRR
jgi:hypothetical protein